VNDVPSFFDPTPITLIFNNIVLRSSYFVTTAKLSMPVDRDDSVGAC
jgi:hypothetical protein